MFISPKVKSICSHSVFFCLCNPWQPLINSLSVFPILDFSHIWNLIMVCPLCLACFTLKAAQSCPILCHPVDYTVHGILQARILEWVAVPFSRASSQPGDQTQVSHISGGFFTSWTTRQAIGYDKYQAGDGFRHKDYLHRTSLDFPGGPVVKTFPSSTRGEGSIPGWVAKIPHAPGPENQTMKNRNNIVQNPIKTLKMIHIKNKSLFKKKSYLTKSGCHLI